MPLLRGHFPGTAQHLVDFTRVHLFDVDHLTGELLESDRAILHQREQVAIQLQRDILGLQ